jgi:hypothetical protein
VTPHCEAGLPKLSCHFNEFDEVTLQFRFASIYEEEDA